MFHLLLLVTLIPDAPPAIDWKELVQKPNAGLPVPDLGLRPLLVARDGKNVTKKADWNEVRKALKQSWLAQMGTAPEKPDRLDVRLEKAEKCDGYTRQLLNFLSEGDDCECRSRSAAP